MVTASVSNIFEHRFFGFTQVKVVNCDVCFYITVHFHMDIHDSFMLRQSVVPTSDSYRICVFTFVCRHGRVRFVLITMLHVLWKPQLATWETTRADMRNIFVSWVTYITYFTWNRMRALWMPQETPWETTRENTRNTRDYSWRVSMLYRHWN